LDIGDIDVLNSIRLLRDGLEVVLKRLKLTESEEERLLATGTLRDERIIKLFRTQAEVPKTKTFEDVERLWNALSRKNTRMFGDGLTKDSMKYFLKMQNKFVVSELNKLEKDASESALKAKDTRERMAWNEQADQFSEMRSMNEDNEDYDDENYLARVFRSLKLSEDSSRISKTQFLDYCARAVIPMLPERWFMDKLHAKKSRNFVAQMSLRFGNSSKSLLS
jgi:hypothetical protein